MNPGRSRRLAVDVFETFRLEQIEQVITIVGKSMPIADKIPFFVSIMADEFSQTIGQCVDALMEEL